LCLTTNHFKKEPEWLNSEKSVRFSLPEQTKCDDGKHKESNVSCLKQECQPQVKLGHDFFEEHHRSDVYKNSFQRQNFCQLPGPIGQYSLRRNASYGEGLGDPYTNYQVKGETKYYRDIAYFRLILF